MENWSLVWRFLIIYNIKGMFRHPRPILILKNGLSPCRKLEIDIYSSIFYIISVYNNWFTILWGKCPNSEGSFSGMNPQSIP